MCNRINILVFEGKPTLFAGGQERSLFEIISGLRKRGIGVTLAYEEEGDLLPEYQAMGVDTFIILTRNVSLNSWETPRSLFKFAISIWETFKRYRSKQEKWGLIYVNQYADLPLATICSFLFRIPIVCHLRLPAHPELCRIHRWGLLKADRLIAISNSTKQSYVDVGIASDKIDVIFNAIDTSCYRPADKRNDNSDKKIVYFGRLSQEKGLTVLIDAFKIDKLRTSNATLHLYGSDQVGSQPGVYLDELKLLSGDLLNKKIFFHGHIIDTVTVLQSADILVLPSLWEAFGRVLIEAMACGVPVIGSRVGGIQEILGDQFPDWLVPPGDSAVLGEKIYDKLFWRETNPELSAQCREYVVRHFDRQRLVDNVLSIMEQVSC